MGCCRSDQTQRVFAHGQNEVATSKGETRSRTKPHCAAGTTGRSGALRHATPEQGLITERNLRVAVDQYTLNEEEQNWHSPYILLIECGKTNTEDHGSGQSRVESFTL